MARRTFSLVATLVLLLAGCAATSPPPSGTEEGLCARAGVSCAEEIHVDGVVWTSDQPGPPFAVDRVERSIVVTGAALSARGDVVRLNATGCGGCDLTIRDSALQVHPREAGELAGTALLVEGFRHITLENVTIEVPAGGSGEWTPPYRTITDGYYGIEVEGDVDAVRLTGVTFTSPGTAGTALRHVSGTVGLLALAGVTIERFGQGVAAEAERTKIADTMVTCVDGDFTHGIGGSAASLSLDGVSLQGCTLGVMVYRVGDASVTRTVVTDGAIGIELGADPAAADPVVHIEDTQMIGQRVIGILLREVALVGSGLTLDRSGHGWTAGHGLPYYYGGIVMFGASGAANDSTFANTRPYAITYSTASIYHAQEGHRFDARGNEWIGPDPTLMPKGVPAPAMEEAPGNHITEEVEIDPI